MLNRPVSILMLNFCAYLIFAAPVATAEGKPTAVKRPAPAKSTPTQSAPAQQISEQEAKDLAQKHYANGLAFIESEDFASAASEFKASVNLFPTKEGYFNMANCYKAIDQYAEALDAIVKLRIDFGKELTRKWKKDIDDFEASVRALVANLTINVNVEGAAILVDGLMISTSPMKEPLMLAVGEHEISVSMPGYETEARTVKLRCIERRGTTSKCTTPRR